MNWSKDKSLALSTFCVYLFLILLAGVCLSAPWLIPRLLVAFSPKAMPLLLATTYAAAVPAFFALWGLRRLLYNIGAGLVFTSKNVAVLRRLSWCCIAAGLVFLASCLYYIPFLVLSAAAAFAGLILRVVKNVFAEAVSLKEENDFTI